MILFSTSITMSLLYLYFQDKRWGVNIRTSDTFIITKYMRGGGDFFLQLYRQSSLQGRYTHLISMLTRSILYSRILHLKYPEPLEIRQENIFVAGETFTKRFIHHLCNTNRLKCVVGKCLLFPSFLSVIHGLYKIPTGDKFHCVSNK